MLVKLAAFLTPLTPFSLGPPEGVETGWVFPGEGVTPSEAALPLPHPRGTPTSLRSQGAWTEASPEAPGRQACGGSR